jgi:hypothetical protein
MEQNELVSPKLALPQTLELGRGRALADLRFHLLRRREGPAA